jgi:hypothetical protein
LDLLVSRVKGKVNNAKNKSEFLYILYWNALTNIKVPVAFINMFYVFCACILQKLTIEM